MIELKLVQFTDLADIKILVDYKLALMKYHLQYAIQSGIIDNEIINYSEEQAKATLHERDSYLIMLNSKPIGYIQAEIKKSIIGDDDILFIHGIYVEEKYRGYSYAITACKYLYKKYKLSIECQCWYNLPASKIYEKLGFKKIVTHYRLQYN